MLGPILNLDRSAWFALLAGGLIVFAVVAVLLSFAKQRRRVQDISNALQAASPLEGESDHVETPSSLEKKLRESDARLAFQHRSLTALLAISDASEEPLTLEAIFARALHTVQDVTGFSTVVVRLYDPDRRCFEVKAQHGMSPDMLASMKCAPIEGSVNGEAARRRWPVWVPDLSANRFTWDGPTPTQAGYRSVVSIPLLTENLVVGTMELASPTEYQWSEAELTWLALVGRTIGSIIHQVQLTEKMRDYAILEERFRLSQEIHDGLVQVIGSIRLWADDALESLNSQDCDAVRLDVAKIETYARETYANLREELMGLRDTILPGEDIIPVLREYVSRFQRQWGIEVQLVQTDKEDPNSSAPVSPKIEIQLLRIIQEALTNVRKHSHATHVDMLVHKEAGGMRVTIRDNGKGFAPEDISGDHLGLHIMRERAASIGGALEISAAEGCGTSIIVDIPAHAIQA